ncbi:MAG TPA: hypothetical protein VGM56_02105 [Byssovorax sp.]
MPCSTDDDCVEAPGLRVTCVVFTRGAVCIARCAVDDDCPAWTTCESISRVDDGPAELVCEPHSWGSP